MITAKLFFIFSMEQNNDKSNIRFIIDDCCNQITDNMEDMKWDLD